MVPARGRPRAVDSKADAGPRSRILVWMLQIVIGVVSMTSTVHAAETNYDESAVGSYTDHT